MYDFQGGDWVKIKAYEVPTIAQIRKEIRKGEYPHLQGLWFSDESHYKEFLEANVLISSVKLCPEGKTTKICVVYDALSKEGKRGVSLNDCLHVGPALSPLLYDILIWFREEPWR